MIGGRKRIVEMQKRKGDEERATAVEIEGKRKKDE